MLAKKQIKRLRDRAVGAVVLSIVASIIADWMLWEIAYEEMIIDQEIERNDTSGLISWGVEYRPYGFISPSLVRFAQIVIQLFCIKLFLNWKRSMYLQLEWLEFKHLKFTTHWVSGWYFIPIANLIQPPRVMAEIRKGSAHMASANKRQDWRLMNYGQQIAFWWMFYLLHWLVLLGYLFYLFYERVPDEKELYHTMLFKMVGNTLYLVSGIFLIMIILKISKLQLNFKSRHQDDVPPEGMPMYSTPAGYRHQPPEGLEMPDDQT